MAYMEQEGSKRQRWKPRHVAGDQEGEGHARKEHNQVFEVFHGCLGRLFFQVVEVIAHGALVGARDFFLAQGALGF